MRSVANVPATTWAQDHLVVDGSTSSFATTPTAISVTSSSTPATTTASGTVAQTAKPAAPGTTAPAGMSPAVKAVMGACVGVIAVAAIIGLVFLYRRRRRRLRRKRGTFGEYQPAIKSPAKPLEMPNSEVDQPRPVYRSLAEKDSATIPIAPYELDDTGRRRLLWYLQRDKGYKGTSSLLQTYDQTSLVPPAQPHRSNRFQNSQVIPRSGLPIMIELNQLSKPDTSYRKASTGATGS